MTARPDAIHGFEPASVRQSSDAETRRGRTLLPLAVALVGAGLVAGAAIALHGLLIDDAPTIALGLAELAFAAYLGVVVTRLARDSRPFDQSRVNGHRPKGLPAARPYD